MYELTSGNWNLLHMVGKKVEIAEEKRGHTKQQYTVQYVLARQKNVHLNEVAACYLLISATL